MYSPRTRSLVRPRSCGDGSHVVPNLRPTLVSPFTEKKVDGGPSVVEVRDRLR